MAEHIIEKNPENIIYSWFLWMINQEIKKIVLETYKPELKLYTKYLMKNFEDDTIVREIIVTYGKIEVIYNPGMDELIKIEG